MNLATHYLIALLVTSAATFLLGAFVMLRDPRRPLNRIFGLYSWSIALWSLGQGLHSIAPDVHQSLRWAYLSHYGVVFIPTFFVHFVALFLEFEARRRRRVVMPCYAFSLFFAAVNGTPLYIAGVAPKFSLQYFIEPGFFYPWSIVFFSVCAVYGLLALFRAYVKASGALRNQLKYLCWSSLFGYVGGMANFFLVFNLEIVPWNPFGTYAVPLYVLVTTYAIVRYRLMDINVALTRVALFVMVYVPLLLLPIVGGNLLQPVLTSWLGDRWWIGPTLLEALFAVGGLVVYRDLRQKAEAMLFHTQQQYQAILRQAAREIPFIHERPRLLEQLAALLIQAAGASVARLYIWDPQSQRYQPQGAWGDQRAHPPAPLEAHDPVVVQLGLQREPLFIEELAQQGIQEATGWHVLGITLLIPCFVRDRPAGILALGEKRSGQPYTSEDVSILFVLATQLGLALENIKYLEELGLTQEQLRQSDRLATAGRLAATMAHEIKQPLTVIKTFVETLPTRGDEVTFRDQFQAVVGRELHRMETTARQLTEFARPRPPHRQRVDLRGLIEETAAFLQPECLKRGVQLECHIPDPLELEADPDQLNQALLNLALNGLDAMEATSWTLAKPRQLTIHATANSHEVELAMADTGCGLRPEEIAQLFDPFYTTKGEGTGLGLVVVKQIVEAHQGTIQVHSTYGQGTTFTIRLPVVGQFESFQRGLTSLP